MSDHVPQRGQQAAPRARPSRQLKTDAQTHARSAHGPHAADVSDMQAAANGSPAVLGVQALQRAADAGSLTRQRRAMGDQADTSGGKAGPGQLPADLRAGMETLSGIALDDVRVHRNSGAPAQVGALAYAQGRDIHLGPGQEKHLPHEAWHVVQQAQGRVKPTLQAKGVAINDDAGLEAEADVMGAKALQAKPMSATSLKSAAPSPVIQRVDDAIRAQTDTQMDGLKARTKLILAQLNAKGANWKATWGEQAESGAKGKAKAILNNEKGESTETMIVKKIWSELTPEEKLDVISNVASAGFQALKTAIDVAPDRGKKAASEPAPKKAREEDETSSGAGRQVASAVAHGLGQMTSDDFEAALRFLHEKRKFEKKIAKTKAQIEGVAGDAGRAVGEAVGDARDDYDFGKLIKAMKPEFLAARGKLHELEKAIADNTDVLRYDEELDALGWALDGLIGGPSEPFRLGDLSAEARLTYPERCAEAIQNINDATRQLFTGDSTADGAAPSGLLARGWALGAEVVGKAAGRAQDATGVGKSDAAKVAVAQEQTASALKFLVRQDWSAVTSWGSTPKGVKAIRGIDRGMDAKPYLTDAKEKAVARGPSGSGRDAEVTQPFYVALQQLNIDDVGALKTAAAALVGIEAALKKKTS